MHLRFVASLVIFLGSYLPLSLILLAQDFRYDLIGLRFCWAIWSPSSDCDLPFRTPFYSLSIFGVCLLCFVIALLALSSAAPERRIEVIEARYVPAELMSYTLPYIVSFMSIDYQETGKFLGLVIFLTWMFIITHRSGQVILNPLLIVFGWRLYELRYQYTGQKKVHSDRAISRDDLNSSDFVTYDKIQDVLIIKKEGDQGA